MTPFQQRIILAVDEWLYLGGCLWLLTKVVEHGWPWAPFVVWLSVGAAMVYGVGYPALWKAERAAAERLGRDRA